MSDKQLYHIWDFVARIVGAIPPIAVAMYYFPTWISQGQKNVVSGSFIIVALIASIPLFSKIKSLMDFITNASMPVLWLIGLALAYILKNISNQLMYICIGGLIGSALSAAICILRNRYQDAVKDEKKDKDK